MARRPWLPALAVAWALVCLIALGVAAGGVVSWRVVSILTIANGVIAGVRWWSDRRARLVAEMTAATARRASSVGDDAARGEMPPGSTARF